MNTFGVSLKMLLVLAATSFIATIARSDSYSWENLQSDIPGVAAHTDPNLVNPWGMAASSNGTIWVSDNEPHGSVFCVLLPGAVGAADAPPGPTLVGAAELRA